jgi:ABC-type multidrug transport system ATPase subunit
MITYSLETFNLSHRYAGRQQALDNVGLRVPQRSIYGFLGPNGAGKTTTLRLVLGLLKKQEGQIHFFGKPFEENRTNILEKVGSLIESPSVYGHLSAEENLLVYQKIYRCPRQRIEDVLRVTGLGDTGRKKAGHFSLGMKQRLAIAIALLNDPKLLILDEPTNGLDPAGIIAMRELLWSLNKGNGVTILLSSHLLSEIRKLATHLGVISRGQLVFQGTMAELGELSNGDLEETFIRLTEN